MESETVGFVIPTTGTMPVKVIIICSSRNGREILSTDTAVDSIVYVCVCACVRARVYVCVGDAKGFASW